MCSLKKESVPYGTKEFTWSFEHYVEFVQYSTRVLCSKGWAVGCGIGPLPYHP